MEKSEQEPPFMQKEKYNLSSRKLKKEGVRLMNEYQKSLINSMLYEKGLIKKQKDGILSEIKRVEVFLKKEFRHRSYL